jgi:hypothetical protein
MNVRSGESADMKKDSKRTRSTRSSHEYTSEALDVGRSGRVWSGGCKSTEDVGESSYATTAESPRITR